MTKAELDDAIDGLMAYDLGASGIHDEVLRQRVKDHLRALPDREFLLYLSRYARENFLSEKALANRSSIEDVSEFIDWLDRCMGFCI